ncbi:MAG TPA: hypothetical protein VLC09_21910 [Polyangiaceae bacterium]|nr:hypothetical protein [Polyangiaceae bacterium]
MLRRWFTALALASLSLACTSRAPQELAAPPPGSPAPSGYYQGGSTEAGKSAAPSGSRYEHPQAESADTASPYRPTRPGLATTFGESRTSHVTEVPFERDSSEPAAWARVQYDDRAGVGAATGYTSGMRPHELPLLGGALAVRVVDGDEDPLPGVFAGGTSYVVGERGERYQIQIENRTASRFEIVASVDGLDVLDGQPGSVEKRGYLVAPYATLLIEGFRTSNSDVAVFRFGGVGESYAAWKGATRNVGVIGVAAFAERRYDIRPGRPYAEPPIPYYPYGYDYEEQRRRQDAQPFPSR